MHNTIFYSYLCLALQKNQEMNIENTQAQMRKGILEYCILLIISQQDAYVPDIISKLKASKMIVVEGVRDREDLCSLLYGRSGYGPEEWKGFYRGVTEPHETIHG